MASKIKLIKKLGSNPTDKSELYYAQVKKHDANTYQDLQYEGSGLTEETMNHAIGKLVKGIKASLAKGEPFKIEGLGTFKIKVKSTSAATPEGLKASKVKYNGVQFLVNKDWKDDLEDLKFEFDGSGVNSESDEDDSENSTPDPNREEVE